MRDRLIEILEQADFDFGEHSVECEVENVDSENYYRFIADHLLANGVIVPPCKVGDTVYIIDEGDEGSDDYVLDVKVTQLFVNKHGIALDLALPLGVRLNTWAVVGKTVFLTREEAEKALAEREGKG